MGALTQPSPAELIKKGVHEPADASNNATASSTLLWAAASMADGMLPWGTLPKQRDRQLRDFWPTETFLSGALATVVARNAGFGYKLEGPDLSVQRAEEVLKNSEYGKGWEHLWTKETLDWYSQDSGSFVQIIRQQPNNPNSPVVNLTHLDSQRVYPTGNPKTPYAYIDRKNKWHALEWFQCRNLMEMPSPVENIAAGVLVSLQYSALTRVLKAAQVLRDVTIYKSEKVSGRFLRGIHIVGGVSQKELDDSIQMQKVQLDQMGLLRYLQPLIVTTLDPGAKVSHELIELATLPEGWDEEKTNRAYIMALAMGFLTDYQEFAPLPGGGLGTSAQSEMLHQKSRGKGPALYKAAVAQLMNFGGVLPQNVKFVWDEQDTEEDKAVAEAAGMRAANRAVMIANHEIDEEASRQMAVDAGDIPKELVAEIESRSEQRKLEEAEAAQAAFDRQPALPGATQMQPAFGQPTGAAVKMLPALIDLITGDVKDAERRLSLGAFLQTRIHKAFTMAADDLAALGYMDTEGRIALSGVIGDCLREFQDQTTGQDATEDVFAICMQVLNGEEITDLVKAVGKAMTVPPGRKKAEAAAESIVQEDVFDDIFQRLAERLVSEREKDYTAPVVVKPKKKRTRTKVVRDKAGAISETLTEEL